jgi:hypothetical protein
LFTALKPKQLAMSGLIYGELPLYVDNPKWIIHNGWIKNDGGLTLRLDKDIRRCHRRVIISPTAPR